MIALAYVSTASNMLTESVLDAIWRKAAISNKDKGITGILLYKGGTFLQVLEGSEEAVEELYGRLNLDSRHSDVLQIYKVPIVNRQYPEWSMAFSNLDAAKEPGRKNGFTELFVPLEPETPSSDHLHRVVAFFVNEIVEA